MIVSVLGSGSRGNACVVRQGETHILVDAGFSFKALRARMAMANLSPEFLNAIFITHEHADHIQALPMFAKRCPVDVYASPGTIQALRKKMKILPPLHPIRGPMVLGDLHVRAFSVPHDAADPVGFVIADPDGGTLGIATDMGVVPSSVRDALASLDSLILESNHEMEMLINGRYPWAIKQRIRGRNGHLSNEQACEALPSLLSGRLRTLVLAHLSEENNDPELVSFYIREVLSTERATHVKMKIARQHEVMPAWEV